MYIIEQLVGEIVDSLLILGCSEDSFEVVKGRSFLLRYDVYMCICFEVVSFEVVKGGEFLVKV